MIPPRWTNCSSYLTLKQAVHIVTIKERKLPLIIFCYDNAHVCVARPNVKEGGAKSNQRVVQCDHTLQCTGVKLVFAEELPVHLAPVSQQPENTTPPASFPDTKSFIPSFGVSLHPGKGAGGGRGRGQLSDRIAPR
jgi:hypothetical protein